LFRTRSQPVYDVPPLRLPSELSVELAEDDTEELMKELERIKRERAEETARKQVRESSSLSLRVVWKR